MIKSAVIKIVRLILLGRLSRNLALRSARTVEAMYLLLPNFDGGGESIDMTNNCFIQTLIFGILYKYRANINYYYHRHNYNDSYTYSLVLAVRR